MYKRQLLGHTADENSWDSDESCHWNTCECGEEFNRESHDFEWITDKAATETEKGSQHEECKVCGYKLPAVEIPAAGTATEPGKTDNPQTRDSGSILLWLALAFVSCGAVYTLTVKSKKQKG